MATNITTLTELIGVNLTTIAPNVTATPNIDKTAIRFGYFVGIGIIIPIGFIFNTLSIVVLMSAKSLRNSTTGLYLTALAVADNLYLVGELLRWLDTDSHVESYNFLSMSYATCQFVFSLRYGAKLISAWMTVAITAERFLIVTFPLKAVTMCTKKKAMVVILVTYLVCFLLGCFPIFSIGLDTWNGQLECLVTNKKFYLIGNWVVLRVGSLLLPGVVVIVLTVLIVVNLARAKLLRRRTLNEGRSALSHGVETRHTKKISVEKQLTAMLLAVAVAFIVLRLPYTILFYINEYKEEIWNPLDKLFSYRIYVGTKIADLFATVNYAINFFLYCLTGSMFRRQLRVLFGCEQEKHGARKMSTSTATHNTIIHNDRISLSVVKKLGTSPRLNHVGNQCKETVALNTEHVDTASDKEELKTEPDIWDTMKDDDTDEHAKEENQKQEHHNNGFTGC